jgi:hypothetical protein
MCLRLTQRVATRIEQDQATTEMASPMQTPRKNKFNIFSYYLSPLSQHLIVTVSLTDKAPCPLISSRGGPTAGGASAFSRSTPHRQEPRIAGLERGLSDFRRPCAPKKLSVSLNIHYHTTNTNNTHSPLYYNSFRCLFFEPCLGPAPYPQQSVPDVRHSSDEDGRSSQA